MRFLLLRFFLRRDYYHKLLVIGSSKGRAIFLVRRAGFGWSDRPDDAVPHADRECPDSGGAGFAAQRELRSRSDWLRCDGAGAAAGAGPRRGSTLIACETTGRQARLVELDPKYVDTIILRWQESSGGTATLDGDGRSYEGIAGSREPG